MRRLLIAAVLIAFSGCDQMMALQATVPQLCQHLEHQTFAIPPAVRARYELFPAEMTNGVSMSKTFDFDVSVQVPSELSSLQSDFHLTAVTITALDGTDFSFVDSAELTLLGADGANISPTTISYTRSEAKPTIIEWAGQSVDLKPYLTTGTLRYSVNMVGRLPDTDLSTNIDVCASAALKLNYLQQ